MSISILLVLFFFSSKNRKKELQSLKLDSKLHFPRINISINPHFRVSIKFRRRYSKNLFDQEYISLLFIEKMFQPSNSNRNF